MSISEQERTTLRELAKRVAEIAALPHQQEKRRLWKLHNALKGERPMVLAYPEGAWLECLPPEQMVCQDPILYAWEQRLRMQIFYHEQIGDDHIVDPYFNIAWDIQSTSWGLEVPRLRAQQLAWTKEEMYHLHPNLSVTLQATGKQGAYSWEPPIQEPGDLDKLKPISYRIDRATSRRNLQRAQDLFGDILTVRQHGWMWVGAGIANHVVQLRGMHQLMMDVYDRPDWVHKLCQFVARAVERRLLSWEHEGLLSTNNDSEWVGSGGVGCTDELPAADFNPSHVRLVDMWGTAESQDIVGFSPAMLEEYFLQYTNPIMERFGLNCYGCCEHLHDRIEMIKQIPKLRRVSISPWCNIAKAAEGFGSDYILSCKPNPTLLSTGDYDEELVRTVLVETLRAGKANACNVEVIIKDLHTVQGQPWRIRSFVELAREAAAKTYG